MGPLYSQLCFYLALKFQLNCQKTWALLASLVAIFCTFWAWFSVDRDCFSVLFHPDGDPSVNVDPNGSVVMAWEAGSAMICLFCASVIHAMHFLGHLIVPTPSICYDEDEQFDYEEHHKAIQSIQLPQVIPEVEEKEEEDDDDDESDVRGVYYDADDDDHNNKKMSTRFTVRETVAL